MYIRFIALFALMISTPVLAKDMRAMPIPSDGQTVRYQKGVPTIEDDLTTAGVRVMPMPTMDHGSLQFMVATYNKGTKSYNFGIESISFTQNDTKLAILSKEQLASKAKSRAMWSQIGMAALAGVAAAGQNNRTTITTYSPHGTYHTVIQNPGLSDGQTASLAAGGAGIALSQIGLQHTLDALDDEIVQTTTVDPQSGYGGRIVCEKLKNVKPGDVVTIAVMIEGELHTFHFNIA